MSVISIGLQSPSDILYSKTVRQIPMESGSASPDVGITEQGQGSLFGLEVHALFCYQPDFGNCECPDMRTFN